MDAPADKEDVRPVPEGHAACSRGFGVHVPHVYESDAARGLLLLEDLGNTQYLARLNAGDDPEPLYGDALAVLAQIQVRGLGRERRAGALRRAANSCANCRSCRSGSSAASGTRTVCGGGAACSRQTFEFLIREALAQPAVFVHRDYHSRNLMLLGERNPGHHRFPGCTARTGRLRPGVAVEGLLHRLAARARRRNGLSAIGRSCWPRAARGRRRRCAVSALVRPDRRAAACEGARDLLPSVVSRRQGRLPARSAAHARLRA